MSKLELGEINTVLATLPGIEQAAVLFDQSDGIAQLLAFLVKDPTQDSINIDNLKTALARSLPTYMIPQQFVTIDQLPRLANGKVNFQSLKLQANELVDMKVCAPKNPLQIQLSDVWEKLLQKSLKNIDIGFFEAGGNSLLVTRLGNEIRLKFGLKIPLRLLMESPSIRQLEWLIEDAGQAINSNKLTAADADLVEIEI
jgi:D-alanine--poly(phosphoribitol) ligase subunit 1